MGPRGASAGAGSAAGTSTGASAGPWPFTLVQGPPGTGKSHTLWGMLNALHVLARAREHAAIVAALGDPTDADIELEFDSADEQDEEDAPRGRDGALAAMLARCMPRLLVCAPSNVAVDVLLSRILEQRFLDANGRAYEPSLARLASEGTDTAAAVARADCGKQLEALLRLSGGDRAKRVSATEREQALQRQRITAARLEGQHDALVAACRAFRAAHAALQRLRATGPGWHISRREAVELSFLESADIVFTTLGSSGRALFARLKRGFDVVLCDEAAQATEMAALVPLQRSGAAALVLVGDPQQLPATVLSTAARDCLYMRSLFARLTQCGVRALLLTTQFRMHPDICRFPSAYFYQGALRTADSVRARAAQPFHAAPPLHPFAFFDVPAGCERRAPGSSSSFNTAEAELAATLYLRLAATLPPGGAAGRVGVVTPYKGQCDELRRVFRERLGAAVLARLEADKSINTVDGFQGSERDVIIFSCVRTSRGSRNALGHVDDVQRMNVGLTRARHALWVVGHRGALSASPHWAKLIEHARGSDRLIRDMA
jgi:senataxin